VSRGPFGSTATLRRSAVQVSGPPLTVLAWFRPNSTHWGTLWGQFLGSSDVEYVRLVLRGDGRAQAQVKTGGSTWTAMPTPSYGLTTWNCLVLRVQTSNLMHAYLNGTRSTLSTTINWPPSLTRTALGERWSVTPAQCLDGLLGPVAVWAAALSDSQIAALSAGMEPRWLASGLVGYHECHATGDEPDLIGSFDFAAGGTVPQSAEHPQLRRRNARAWELGYRGAA